MAQLEEMMNNTPSLSSHARQELRKSFRHTTKSGHAVRTSLFRYASPCLWNQLPSPLHSVNLIPVPLSLTCLFMLLPRLLTLSTHHSHHP